jgi:hypothetical protein
MTPEKWMLTYNDGWKVTTIDHMVLGTELKIEIITYACI